MADLIGRPEVIWFIIGLVLLLLELVLPGFFIFFFGLGAWVTALVCLIGNPGVNIQIVIFAVTSVVTLVALRRIITKKFFYKESEKNDVDDEFTGREAVATVDFGGELIGKVEFKGTTWSAESSANIIRGQRVIINRKESFKLFVEPKTN